MHSSSVLHLAELMLVLILGNRPRLAFQAHVTIRGFKILQGLTIDSIGKNIISSENEIFETTAIYRAAAHSKRSIG